MAKRKHRDWLADEIEMYLLVSFTEILDLYIEQHPAEREKLVDLKHEAIDLSMSRIKLIMLRYKISFNENWLVDGSMKGQ